MEVKRKEEETLTRSNQTASPAQSLSSQDTLKLVPRLAVGAKHVSNLAARDTNVASGNVGVSANVSRQLAHKGLAETADLVVRLALGVEIRSSFATSYAQTGQSILEDLLKSKKLETIASLSAHMFSSKTRQEKKENLHGQVDGGVESKTALVWAEGRVELHTVSPVDAELALVVLPGDAELDNSLGNGGDLQSGAVFGVLLEEAAVFEGAGQLCSEMC